jgi:hypothetical protein
MATLCIAGFKWDIVQALTASPAWSDPGVPQRTVLVGPTFEFSGARLFARPLERFVSPLFFGGILSGLKRRGHFDF